MEEEKVYTENKEGEKLVGLKTIPEEEKEKYQTVILVHGFGVDKSEKGMFDELVPVIVENGFLTYRFDFSGRGESEGDYSKTSLTKQKDDLEKIIEFVNSENLVDYENIGILAQSFGTVVTVALVPKAKTIILIGSDAHPKDIVGLPKKWKVFNQEGISERITSLGEVIKIGTQFWKDFDNYDLLSNIKKIHCPILFIHGSEDDIVPISETEAYFKNANEPKEKFLLEGANHDLNPNREKAFQAVVNWFKEHLK